MVGETTNLAFEDCPYLVLSAPEGAVRLRRAYEGQLQNGADVDFLLPDALRDRVEWIKLAGVGAAIIGRSGEGWFEPFLALRALRRKAESLGVT